MTKAELKTLISNKLIRLMGEWFEGKPLYQALGITIVQTNVNKFDSLIDMLTDAAANYLMATFYDYANIGKAKEEFMKILSQKSPQYPSKLLSIIL